MGLVTSTATGVGFEQLPRYFEHMSDIREKITFEELTEPQATAAVDQGYDSWKEEKIRKALKQSEDRSTMTPAKKVWERFGFER